MVRRELLKWLFALWATVVAAEFEKVGRNYAGNEEKNSAASRGRGNEVFSSGADEAGIPRLSFCCPFGSYVVFRNCSEAKSSKPMLPVAFEIIDDELFSDNATIDESAFDFQVWNPCQGMASYFLEPDHDIEDESVLLKNGSIYKRFDGEVLNHGEFCLGETEGRQDLSVLVCYDQSLDYISEFTTGEESQPYPVGMILSIPFFVATFIVYTVISELDNLHGLCLRAYVGCLAFAYLLLSLIQLVRQDRISDSVCMAIAFTIHFSFLASFFWLNVMCFDIWWTFGGFRSLQGSIKQRERKKFLMYSIYAWGCAVLLTAVCVIMDYFPGIPETVLRPEFGVESCWFRTEEAKALYFYGPMGVTVFCNIILFISTAAKIIRHKKDTAHHLKGMDSKRHDDNKQWFNLYLKLFIVMGINWSMEIISWLCQGPKYFWYLTDIANTLQGVIIFIIFVWKDKIKRLLIKRFACKGPTFLSRDSTSNSRTCTTSIPLHEKTNTFPNPVSRVKPSSDDSDGV